MKQIHVICKEGKDGRTLYLKNKKYNGIHYTFSNYILHSRQFNTHDEAKEFLLDTNDLSGPVEIKALWHRDLKEWRESVDLIRISKEMRRELEEVGQIS